MAFIVPFAASASTKRKSRLRIRVVSGAVCQDVEREIGAGRSKSRSTSLLRTPLSGKTAIDGIFPAQRLGPPLRKTRGRSLHRYRPHANIYVNNQKVLSETVSDRDAHGILHHIGSEQIGKVKFCPEKTQTYSCRCKRRDD